MRWKSKCVYSSTSTSSTTNISWSKAKPVEQKNLCFCVCSCYCSSSWTLCYVDVDGAPFSSPNRSPTHDWPCNCNPQTHFEGHSGHARHPRWLLLALSSVLLRRRLPLRHGLHLRFPFRHCLPVINSIAPFPLFPLSKFISFWFLNWGCGNCSWKSTSQTFFL